jgi:hypothetical protein
MDMLFVYSKDLSDDWFCEWLYTPGEDEKPRILDLDV